MAIIASSKPPNVKRRDLVAARKKYPAIKALAELNQWVVWKWSFRENASGEGTWTKPPYMPSGRNANVTNPKTWTDFTTAQEALADKQWRGTGVVLTADNALVAFDLDKCVDPQTLEIAPWANEVIEAVNSYTELSPTTRGIRILVWGSLPMGVRRNGNIEIYDTARYVTITGRHLEGTPTSIEDRSKQLRALHRRFLRPKEGSYLAPPKLSAEDREVIQKARTAKNGGKFRALWTGKWQGLYASQSEADLALASLLLYWTMDDAARAERMFRSSALYRDKWDEKHFADGRTYGQSVLELAGRNPHNNRGSKLNISRPNFGLRTFAQLLRRAPAESLVEDILYRNTLAALVGQEASFKSFAALDLALSVAMGVPFHGHDTTGGDVVYVSAEGGNGLLNRVWAWKKTHDKRLGRRVHFLVDQAPQFLSSEHMVALRGAIAKLPRPPALIVFDTLARCFVGGDENSAQDMGKVVYQADELRRETGATLLLIHHIARSSGITRGSTALPGAVDTLIRADRKGDLVVLTCGKMKDAPEFEPLRLRRRLVELKLGRSSVVLERTLHVAEERGVNNQRILTVLKSFGDEGAGSSAWKRACVEDGVPGTTFENYRRSLVEAGMVQRSESGRAVRYRLAQSQVQGAS